MADSDSDEPPLPPMLQEDADATMYKYRDFANVPDDPDSDPSPSQSNRSLESSIRVQKFPVKLYSILGQKEFGDIITWMPHGRSWKVLKPNLFESLVMPLFFEYSNYHSFNRLVNAWSFRRISSGTDRGSYYHELFLRGKPHLQKYMRRLPKTHKKLPMKKLDEPEFYKLDKTNPLPELEDSQALNPGVLALRRNTAGGSTGGPGSLPMNASSHSFNHQLSNLQGNMAAGMGGSAVLPGKEMGIGGLGGSMQELGGSMQGLGGGMQGLGGGMQGLGGGMQGLGGGMQGLGGGMQGLGGSMQGLGGGMQGLGGGMQGLGGGMQGLGGGMQGLGGGMQGLGGGIQGLGGGVSSFGGNSGLVSGLGNNQSNGFGNGMGGGGYGGGIGSFNGLGGGGLGNGYSGLGGVGAASYGHGQSGVVSYNTLGSNALGENGLGGNGLSGNGFGGNGLGSNGLGGNINRGSSLSPGSGGNGGLGGSMSGGGSTGGQQDQLFQLQRLRHLQHLQLFQRQVGATSLSGTDDLARLQAEHALGLRGR